MKGRRRESTSSARKEKAKVEKKEEEVMEGKEEKGTVIPSMPYKVHFLYSVNDLST